MATAEWQERALTEKWLEITSCDSSQPCRYRCLPALQNTGCGIAGGRGKGHNNLTRSTPFSAAMTETTLTLSGSFGATVSLDSGGACAMLVWIGPARWKLRLAMHLSIFLCCCGTMRKRPTLRARRCRYQIGRASCRE